MIGQHGPALAFWLSYLDYQGGLWEQSGDTVLAILPGQLSAQHDLPETALITDDPDIAREDGVLFLGSGHPEIDKGAETIIGTGDVGALTLPHRAKQTSTEDLLAKIRDQVPVDHGRIDATGSILRSHRSLLRLGALVSHTVSADEQFTEVAECLLDVPSRVAWAPDAADRLLSAIGTSEATAGPEVRASRLASAVAAAHRELDTAAARRGQELSNEADAERSAEITRATEYYAAALAAIDKRRTGADEQRRALLDARAQADDRRARPSPGRDQREVPPSARAAPLPAASDRRPGLAPGHRRPARRTPLAHGLRLPAVARHRGAHPVPDLRRPLPAGGHQDPPRLRHLRPGHNTAAPPGPGGRETAARTCATERAADRDRSRPGAGAQAAAARQHAGDRPEAARRRPGRPPRPSGTEHSRTGCCPTPLLPGKPEERKIVDFWNQVGAGETRKLSRLIAPDSPLAALTRLYGTAGPLHGIGVPAGHTPVSFTNGNYDRPVAGQRGGTAGELRTRHGQYPYLLLWSPDKLLDEVFPYSAPWHLGRAQRLLEPPTHVPAPYTDLDKVAQLLLTRVAARHGLTFAARALAAWWRLPDPDILLARFSPRVVAATVDRAVRYWSGASQAGYPDAAAAFTADQADIRKATPMLQKQLQLSSTRNW